MFTYRQNLIKAFTLAMSCILLCGCENDMSISNDISKDNIRNDLSPLNRDSHEIIKLALLANPGETDQTRNSDSENSLTMIPLLWSSTRANNDTVAYAVEYGNDKGFAIIAARHDVEPLLALIDNGGFLDEETSKNSNFQLTLQQTLKYASEPSPSFISLTSDVPPHPETTPGYYDTIQPKPKKDPILKVAWGQHWPEGIFCPNKLCGCGPTAVAQILSALRVPLTINYNFPEADIDSEVIDWNDLRSHSQSCYNESECIYNQLCPLSFDKHITLGRICRQIGYDINATYFSSPIKQTSSYPSDNINEIQRLSGKNAIKLYDTSRLYTQFTLGNKIAFTYGYGNDGGHAWVTDGIWEVGLTIIFRGEATVVDPTQPPTLASTVIKQSSKYFHFNWGWNGNCNGYFLKDIFDPQDAYSYDNGYGFYSGSEFANNFGFAIFTVN